LAVESIGSIWEDSFALDGAFNVYDQKISDSIRYHTNKISKTFELKNNDRDDVRQTLYLAALEADRTYDPSGPARKSTYIKAAIGYRAIDIMRNLERMPQVVCYEEGDDPQETATLYQKAHRDVHEELSNPDAPKSRPPVQIDCGNHMQNVAVAPEAPPLDTKSAVWAVVDKLHPRQQAICWLLMNGLTNKEVAASIGMHKNTVQREIAAIRKVFIKHNFRKF